MAFLLTSIALVLLSCSMVGPAPAAPPGTQLVRVIVSVTDVRLDPPSVQAGDVDFVLDFARDETQHAREGLFFVSGSGQPDAPRPLSTQEVARIEQGTDEGLAVDGGWGVAPMRMTLQEGLYAFILRPDDTPPGSPPPSIAVLEVVAEGA